MQTSRGRRSAVCQVQVITHFHFKQRVGGTLASGGNEEGTVGYRLVPSGYSPWATLHTKRRTPHFQRMPKTRLSSATAASPSSSFGRFFGSQVGVTMECFFFCGALPKTETGRVLQFFRFSRFACASRILIMASNRKKLI